MDDKHVDPLSVALLRYIAVIGYLALALDQLPCGPVEAHPDSESGIQQSQQQNQPSNQPRSMPIAEQSQTVSVPEKDQPKPAIYTSACGQTENHDQADLCEQRRMAKAAIDAVWWTRAQTILGIFGFFAVLGSLGFAGWAGFAASDAAKAAQRSANISEHAFRRLERPYLFVHFDNTSLHFLRIKGVPPQMPFLTFRLVNYGKMPAILRSITAALEPTIDFPSDVPIDGKQNVYEVINQGEASGIFPRVYVSGSKAGDTWDDTPDLIFHGIYKYDDPTGATHTDRFCMRGTQTVGSFVINGGHERNWRKTEYPENGEAEKAL